MPKAPAVQRRPAPLPSFVPPSLAGDAILMVGLLEARTVRLESGITKFRPGQGPTPDERDAAAKVIADLDHALGQAVSDRWIEEAVLQLLGAMKWRREDQDLQAITDAFLIAMAGRAHGAVVEAVRRILRGEAGISKTFVPTCAELSQAAFGIEGEWQAVLWKLRQLLTLSEARLVAPEGSVKLGP